MRFRISRTNQMALAKVCMEAILQSFFLVLAGEMGDKTQLLALVLAARFRKPWMVMAGIFVATLLNHALSSWLGELISSHIAPEALKWILAASFFFFAAWMLVPDKEGEFRESGHWGVFLSTTVAFFFAEMGDKTQLATVALGAMFGDVILVTLGSTIGMLAANALAVFCGHNLLDKIPMNWVRRFASMLFVISGIVVIAGL